MHIRVALFIIYIAICFPLYLLYVLVIGLLITRSEFSSSFYTFFIFAGFIDLTYFTMNVFFYYLPFIPGALEFYARFQEDDAQWRQEYSWLLSIANMLMYYLPSIQDVTNLFISLNRFVALLFPLMFSRIYMMHAESKEHFPSINRSSLISAHMFTCNAFCFLIYSISAIHIIRSQVINMKEVRLFLLGFLILLTNAPSIAYQIYWSIYQTEGSSYVFMLPWVIMVKTLAPPLLLILTNTGMRREIRLIFNLRRSKSIIRDSTQTSAYS